jgi:hypothetical protein
MAERSRFRITKQPSDLLDQQALIPQVPRGKALPQALPDLAEAAAGVAGARILGSPARFHHLWCENHSRHPSAILQARFGVAFQDG